MQVLETSNVPVKAWVDGVPFEDAARAQVMNVASLPFVHEHVAVMPDVHWGMGATVGSVIATKGAVIPAAVGVDVGCFVGETRIPLLDGTQATLAELHARTEPFWLYSIGKDLRIVPGRARCVQTRADAELMRIVVSGGEEVVCTPDHRFMLSDGSFREAKDLRFNDSLMPLYRKWETRDGYESCNSGRGTGRVTHILVWEALNGAVPPGHVVHHRNHVHFDNRPENLELMTSSEHSAHHRATCNTFRNSDPEFQYRRLAGVARRRADPTAAAKMAEVGAANITTFMRERPEAFAAAVKDNGQRGAPHLATFNRTPRACPDCGHVAQNPIALLWHQRREHGREDRRTRANHKVIQTERLTRRADVYCLRVEHHHNFALAAGVFVHNCGMVAARLGLTANELPDSLAAMRSAIEAAVPHGRTHAGGAGDRGAWGKPGVEVAEAWTGDHGAAPQSSLASRFRALCATHPKLEKSNNVGHLGTLGTGNHFIEVCLDETRRVWVMLHSGSRGIGAKIGSFFIELAKQDMRRHFVNLPDVDLAYLSEGTEHFDDYVEAVGWAQDFARMNRNLMLSATLRAMARTLGRPILATSEAINCHHNYVSREHHFGADVLVTRKGAVRAREGELGIIPGSMGTRSYIVRGKGNAQSVQSCSHGAGRRMSRTQAKKTFTAADHAKAVAGVECRLDDGVIDETPGAYKDVDAVMAAQADLVDVVHTLKQVLCVKG